MIERLPLLIPCPSERPGDGSPDHPMRKVTWQVAFEPGGWTPERQARVAQLFDGLAPEWHTRDVPGREDAITDALARGGLPDGLCVEIGSGIGRTTRLLAERFRRLLACDLSYEMLYRAPADPGLRVQADAAVLPLPDGGADVVVLENMLLFPREMDRVLAPAGVLVWVNSLGHRTPIHLPPEDVARALPGAWTGVTAEAGWGIWCALRRASRVSASGS